MKKTMIFILSLVLLFSTALPSQAQEEKTTVVTTIFPIYDWVRQIVGDTQTVEITMLLDNGVDLHSYQPTAQDILKISSCDLFIYVGGESDDWVEDVLKSAMNPDLRSISLVEAMGDLIKAEEIVEGMEHEHDHGHEEDEDHDHEEEAHEHEEEEEHDHDHEADEEHDHDHDHDHEEELDEHVWLSLRNASRLVTVIADTLAQVDPAHAGAYQSNAAAYTDQLSALDSQYAAAVESAAFDTLLFGDRFPFRYLTDDYGLSYYAAFSGCSAESEASFATIIFLAQKVDELGLPAVMTIEYPKTRIADTVVNATKTRDQKILSLDSMQGTTSKDLEAGVTYLSVMESNLEILKEALN